ncbi:hypothetical protein H4R33_002714, partial [Dimargaris cristalligena]
ANNASKKLAVTNQQTIQRLQLLFFAINGLYVFIRFVVCFGTVSWAVAVAYVGTFLVSLFMFQQLVSMGQPRYGPSGDLVSAGEDLAAPGLTSYMFDILYVTWFIHLGSLVTHYVWYLYLIIPGYAVVKLGGFIWPFLAGFGAGQAEPVAQSPAKRPKVKYARR